MTVSAAVLRQAALSVAAQRRIAPYLRPTPCLASRRDLEDGTDLIFKAENLQRTARSSFAARSRS